MSCYSQCDSLDNKIMIDFLSEKLHESDVQNEKLKYQLQITRAETMKQRTLKWIAIIGGTYI